MGYRNSAVVGLGVALGVGITLVPESLAMFPGWVTLIFGKSAVVVLSTIVTVVLNQVTSKRTRRSSRIGGGHMLIIGNGKTITKGR